jgi:negative regulator of sigma E activity
LSEYCIISENQSISTASTSARPEPAPSLVKKFARASLLVAAIVWLIVTFGCRALNPARKASSYPKLLNVARVRVIGAASHAAAALAEAEGEDEEQPDARRVSAAAAPKATAVVRRELLTVTPLCSW